METIRVLNRAAEGIIDVTGEPVAIGARAWVDPHRDEVIAALAAGTVEQVAPDRHAIDVAPPPVSGADALVLRRQAELPARRPGYEA